MFPLANFTCPQHMGKITPCFMSLPGLFPLLAFPARQSPRGLPGPPTMVLGVTSFNNSLFLSSASYVCAHMCVHVQVHVHACVCVHMQGKLGMVPR